MASRRIGIDTGGTFTDIAVLSPRSLQVHKLPSTPGDPGRAVLQGLEEVREEGEEVDVVHGTTVGLNAVLTGTMARTAFVTNAGFVDLIEIARQERSSLYDLQARRPELPVPRQLRFEVHSRRGADGSCLARSSQAELRELLARLRRARVEAVAIGLLHSPLYPEDELRIKKLLEPLGVPVTCSAELLPVQGEYERFAASILNAAISSRLSAYLLSLQAAIKPGRLRLLRSSGGIMAGDEAARFPARAMFSGPAGGVLATRALARALGQEVVAALDMGGTSTDVCLVQPHALVSESRVAGLPLAIPAVQVHTVGCGGGSLAKVDSGGALQVGPESAGADPGPACYGVGEQATVTDAHMFLGHMGTDTLLSGRFPVDPGRSVEAISRLARILGMPPRRAAEGILEVADLHMLRALLVITVERAVDPMQVPLVAYGGAGGLHASGLRRKLGMPFALVPAHPGAFSAIGLALASESHEEILPVQRELGELSMPELQALAGDLGEKAGARLVASAGVRSNDRGRRQIRVRVVAHMRHRGQGQSLAIPFGQGLRKSFVQMHERLFGFLPKDRPIEIQELRAVAELPGRSLPRMAPTPVGRQERAPSHRRRRPPSGGPAWPVYSRSDLGLGEELSGPCLVEEPTGVTLVGKRDCCRVDPLGLILSDRNS